MKLPQKDGRTKKLDIFNLTASVAAHRALLERSLVESTGLLSVSTMHSLGRVDYSIIIL